MNNDEFERTLNNACFQLEAQTEEVVRRVMIRLLQGVVIRSAVGNPEVWAVNKQAVYFNNTVAEHNAQFKPRSRERVKDSMDIVKPKGYVGGRYRGNWQVMLNTTTPKETGVIDPSGTETLAKGRVAINTYNIDTTHKIWVVNNVPYAMKLEFGHSKQQPSGNVRIAINDFPGILAEVVSEVKKT